MLIRVTISKQSLRKPIHHIVILSAKGSVLKYPFGASELILDNYLRSEFKIGLRECCLEIIYRLKKSTNASEEIAYAIYDEYYDKLAQLITYGVGDIPGSNILIDSLHSAFK